MKLFLKAWYFITRNKLEDISRRHLVKPVAVCLYLLARFTRNPLKRYKMLFLAHRLSYFGFVESLIVEELDNIKLHVIDLIPNDNEVWDHLNQNRNIVLKAPRFERGVVTEKGVLLIKFSTTFQYYLKHVDCAKLQSYFQIVLEPSWAGYCLPEIIGWTNFDEPIVIECSEIKDFQFIQRINSNLVPVRFGSSDWVDHRVFNYSKKQPPKYDAIYVSNYMPIKRNHIFLKALSKIKKQEFRAALVCNAWGDTKENVRVLYDYYKLEGKLDIYEALTQTELNELLADSKVNLLLSLKEGSNRSIFEAFFTNTPGIVLAENIGVNKNYINEKTGKLINERDLVDTLLFFSKHWQNFEPREWAMENISTYKTKEKLDDALQAICQERNQPWTEGTYLKVNKPESRYYDDELTDKMPHGSIIFAIFRKNSPLDTIQMLKSLFPEKTL